MTNPTRKINKPLPKSRAAIDRIDIASETGRELRIASIFTGVVAFFVYLRTMPPGLVMGDGMELSAAAYCLGIPHPTGYPLYMLLLHAFQWLPIGDIITRSAIFSALCMSVAAGLVVPIVATALRALAPTIPLKPCVVISAAFGLTTAFLANHWDNAIVAEVYALQFLIMVGATRALQLASEPTATLSARGSALAKSQDADAAPEPRDASSTSTSTAALSTSTSEGPASLHHSSFILHPLNVAALLIGLGLAHHRISIVLLLPLLLVGIVTLRRLSRERRSPDRPTPEKNSTTAATRPSPIAITLIATTLLLAPLALYAYLPLRAAARPALNWGDPSTPTNFLAHIRGDMYLEQRLLKASTDPAVNQRSSYQEVAASSIRQMLGATVTQFSGLLPTRPHLVQSAQRFFTLPTGFTGYAIVFFLTCIGGGIYALIRVRPIFAVALLLATAQATFLIISYNIADVRDYYLYPLWALALFAFLGLFEIGRQITIHHSLRPAPQLAYLALALPLLVVVTNFKRADRSRDTDMEAVAQMLLPDDRTAVPEGAILITGGDNDTFTAWHAQIARRQRPDIVIYAANFTSRPWYPTFFSADTIARYGLKFYNGYPQDAAEFAGRIAASTIEPNLGRHPIFTSLDDPVVLRLLSQKYNITIAKTQIVESAMPFLRSPFHEFTLLRITAKDDKETTR